MLKLPHSPQVCMVLVCLVNLVPSSYHGLNNLKKQPKTADFPHSHYFIHSQMNQCQRNVKVLPHYKETLHCNACTLLCDRLHTSHYFRVSWSNTRHTEFITCSLCSNDPLELCILSSNLLCGVKAVQHTIQSQHRWLIAVFHYCTQDLCDSE